ncbi:hypothetical protein D3C85_1029410 [compost metagenome]
MHQPQQHRRHHAHGQHQLEAELPPARLRLIHLLLAQLIEQQSRIEAGAETDGQRQACVFQRTDQGQVEQLGDHQGENRDFYRGADVLLRIKARRQHLDQDNPEQPHRIGHQRALSHGGIKGAELTVLEQRNGQRLGQDPQRQGAWQYQHTTQAQAPVEDARVLVTVLVGVGLGQGRQQNGPQRHPQHTGWQLHQAIGVVHPGHRPRHQERGKNSIDDQ